MTDAPDDHETNPFIEAVRARSVAVGRLIEGSCDPAALDDYINAMATSRLLGIISDEDAENAIVRARQVFDANVNKGRIAV
jgi:hypothetical protein